MQRWLSIGEALRQILKSWAATIKALREYKDSKGNFTKRSLADRLGQNHHVIMELLALVEPCTEAIRTSRTTDKPTGPHCLAQVIQLRCETYNCTKPLRVQEWEESGRYALHYLLDKDELIVVYAPLTLSLACVVFSVGRAK